VTLKPALDGTRHVWERPSWKCQGCGEPWPCQDRRTRFLADHAKNRRRLRTMLATWMPKAVQDLGLTTEQAQVRFIGWTL
jgi:hypothetical protein